VLRACCGGPDHPLRFVSVLLKARTKYMLSQVRSRIRNRALLFNTISRASLAKQVSRKAAKTRGLARSETRKVLGILASWREKTEDPVQSAVGGTGFMNQSTKPQIEALAGRDGLSAPVERTPSRIAASCLVKVGRWNLRITLSLP